MTVILNHITFKDSNKNINIILGDLSHVKQHCNYQKPPGVSFFTLNPSHVSSCNEQCVNISICIFPPSASSTRKWLFIFSRQWAHTCGVNLHKANCITETVRHLRNAKEYFPLEPQESLDPLSLHSIPNRFNENKSSMSIINTSSGHV